MRWEQAAGNNAGRRWRRRRLAVKTTTSKRGLVSSKSKGSPPKPWGILRRRPRRRLHQEQGDSQYIQQLFHDFVATGALTLPLGREVSDYEVLVHAAANNRGREEIRVGRNRKSGDEGTVVSDANSWLYKTTTPASVGDQENPSRTIQRCTDDELVVTFRFLRSSLTARIPPKTYPQPQQGTNDGADDRPRQLQKTPYHRHSTGARDHVTACGEPSLFLSLLRRTDLWLGHSNPDAEANTNEEHPAPSHQEMRQSRFQARPHQRGKGSCGRD